jgi:hypothetical protein
MSRAIDTVRIYGDVVLRITPSQIKSFEYISVERDGSILSILSKHWVDNRSYLLIDLPETPQVVPPSTEDNLDWSINLTCLELIQVWADKTALLFLRKDMVQCDPFKIFSKGHVEVTYCD